jgi:Spy/CpxP family protein refolding chaperone
MKRWNIPIALYLFLVFVSGAVVGALGYRAYNPPAARSGSAGRVNPEEWRRQYLNELQTRVNLTPDQVQKVNAILDDTDARFNQARDQHHQAIEQIKEYHRSKLRAIMTPEQLPKYEQFRTERDARTKASKK